MPPARLAAHGAAEALRQRSTMLSRNPRFLPPLGKPALEPEWHRPRRKLLGCDALASVTRK